VKSSSGEIVGADVAVGSDVSVDTVGFTTAVGLASVGGVLVGPVVAEGAGVFSVAVAVARAGEPVTLTAGEGSAVVEPPPKHDTTASRRRLDARNGLIVARCSCIECSGGSRRRHRAGDTRSTLHLHNLRNCDALTHIHYVARTKWPDRSNAPGGLDR